MKLPLHSYRALQLKVISRSLSSYRLGVFGAMAEGAPSPPKSATSTTDGKPRPYSDQKHLNQSKGQGKPGQKRDTHFVCFPLVTDSSIPQLAASLEHFRRVTTLTPEIAKRRRLKQEQMRQQQKEETPEREGGADDDSDEGSDAQGGEREGASRMQEVKDEDLRILPPAAHRPPGTFHLTIGTMDLSEKDEMDRAVRVLKGLELGRMMRDVEREEQVGTGREGRWETKQKQKEGEEAVSTDQRTGEEAADTAKDTVQSLARSISPPPSRPRSKSPSSSPFSAPLMIYLQGLSAFASPRKARVFYAPPHDPSNRLLLLANKIRAVFKAEGFVTEKRELTLHATVANMNYANRARGKGGRGGKGNGKGRGMEVVDGKAVVGVFGGGEGGYEYQEGVKEEGREYGYVWAKDGVGDRVRICKMGAERGEDEVLGMVYPAIRTEDGEVAEVVFGRKLRVE